MASHFSKTRSNKIDHNSSSSFLVQATVSATAALVTWGLYTFLTYDRRWWWKKRARSRKEVSQKPNWETNLIHGTVDPGWEPVYEEFVQNFRCRGELGAALCIYYQGRKVVDIWGGYKDRERQLLWEQNTICPIFSTSKGISAFALLMQESRGRLDADKEVSTYWPEFAQNGKENITIAQLIDHSVGVAGISPPVTLEMLKNPDKRILRNHIAKAAMEWPKAGDYKGYMAIILGFYESALVELTDQPSERTIGQYLRDEAFIPLGIDNELYIGVPAEIPDDRIAKLDAMYGFEPLWPKATAFPDEFFPNVLLRPSSYTARALRNPQLSSMPSPMDYDRRDIQALEIPSANGVASARAVATMYMAIERAIHSNNNNNNRKSTSSTEKGDNYNNPLGFNSKALRRCLQPPKPGRYNGWIDEVLGIECCMGAGFMLPPPPNSNTGGRFWSVPNGFGAPGAGGSLGYCDPDAEIAYAYVMNRCGQCVEDPREFALRSKMYEVVQILRAQEGKPTQLLASSNNAPHYLSKRYVDGYPELAPL